MSWALNSAKTGSILIFLAVLTINTFAQETTAVNVNADSPTDTGFLTGSPFLWLLFVVVLIIIIAGIIRRRRNS